eukprot:Partr_v1_DN28171_c1_g1_i2_m55604 putative Ectonucleoside triphosphate diphosphohydrolase
MSGNSVILAMPYMSSAVPGRGTSASEMGGQFTFAPVPSRSGSSSTGARGYNKRWYSRLIFWATRFLRRIIASPKLLAVALFLMLVVYFAAAPSFQPAIVVDQGSVDTPDTVHDLPSDYILVLDAGSSGTRAYLYKWKWPSLKSLKKSSWASVDYAGKLPEIEELQVKDKLPFKVTPGLSSFAAETVPTVRNKAIADYLTPLFAVAKEQIPASQLKNTPVYVYATAGMRMVPADIGKDIMKSACDFAKSHEMDVPSDCHTVRIIPGDEEGLNGWIAANFLKKAFREKLGHSLAFLDMGGASAQIAFEVDVSALGSVGVTSVPIVTADGKQIDTPVYSKTFLGFGANEARKRYLTELSKAAGSTDNSELLDPCMPKDLETIETTDGGKPLNLKGSGQFDNCVQLMDDVISRESTCPTGVCEFTINTKKFDVATIDSLVGVSEYFYSTDAFDSSKEYSYQSFNEKAEQFCNGNWKDVKTKYPRETDDRLQLQCFKSAWVMSILHTAFGINKIPSDTDKDGVIDGNFEVLNKINGQEASWTFGTVITHIMQKHRPKVMEPPLVAGGAHISDDDRRPSSSASERALEFILFVIIIGAIILLVRSSWFKGGSNGVESWMSNRSTNTGALSMGLMRNRDLVDDIEMGSYTQTMSSPNIGQQKKLGNPMRLGRPPSSLRGSEQSSSTNSGMQ